MTNKKMMIMKDFLSDLGLHSRFNECENKLHILSLKTEKNKEEIVSKCEDLGLKFVQYQKPYYDQINGFIRIYWIE